MIRRGIVIATLMALCAGGVSADISEELVTGMPLRSALEMLRKNGIHAIEDEGDYAVAGAKEQKRYYVHPAESPDALYFVAARKGSEKSLSLVAILWWKDWGHDAPRPKGARQDRQVEVRKVALRSLK